jgi:hypothetical protein
MIRCFAQHCVCVKLPQEHLYIALPACIRLPHTLQFILISPFFTILYFPCRISMKKISNLIKRLLICIIRKLRKTVKGYYSLCCEDLYIINGLSLSEKSQFSFTIKNFSFILIDGEPIIVFTYIIERFIL